MNSRWSHDTMCHIEMISKIDFNDRARDWARIAANTVGEQGHACQSNPWPLYDAGNTSTFDVIFEHDERPNCLLYRLTEVYLCQSGNPLNYFDLFHNKYELGKEETIMHKAVKATFKCYQNTQVLIYQI